MHGEYTCPDGSVHAKSGVTDNSGRARLPVKVSQTGTHTFCLTDIMLDGCVYDPDANNVSPA